MSERSPACPPPDRPQVSLIFPAYNPGARLAETLRQVGPFLDAQAGRWEAVFVCDGCTDGTPERLEFWQKYGRDGPDSIQNPC